MTTADADPGATRQRHEGGHESPNLGSGSPHSHSIVAGGFEEMS